MEQDINALKEENCISAGFLKVEANSKYNQLIESNIEILDMEEEDLEDITHHD